MTDNEIIKALEKLYDEAHKGYVTHLEHNGPRDTSHEEYIDLMSATLALIQRQQERIEDLEALAMLKNKRHYYNRFIKEVWQVEHGELSYPDFDEIYKRYFELKERMDRIVEQLERLPNVNSDYWNFADLIDREDAIEIVKGGGGDE